MTNRTGRPCRATDFMFASAEASIGDRKQKFHLPEGSQARCGDRAEFVSCVSPGMVLFPGPM